MIKIKEKGWVEKLFSEEEGWGEDEARYIEGLGWFIFCVEDNAGSITIVISKEKIEAFPFDEEFARVQNDPNTITICKYGYYGSFAPSEEGEGYLCTKLEGDKYKDMVRFANFKEGDRLLEEYLNGFMK